jgi:hypothetical protein
LEEKRLTIKNVQTQYNYLSKEVELDESYEPQLIKINERFNSTVKILPTIEERMESLENLIHISEKIDNISNQIRNLTTSNTHRFLAEDEEQSIDSTLSDQREVINKMNAYQANLGDLNKELMKNRAYLQSKLPVVVIEKLNDAQETLKRCLNEELDRMHSLLQIQQTDEEKKTKIGTINANIQKIENLLDFDATEYIRRLEMCKNILNYSKQLVNELKINSTTSAASTAATTNTSTPSRPPTPLNQDYQELREIEIKLDGYENEIDMKLNEIQENATKHKRMKEKIDEIEKHLTKIKNDRLLADLNINFIMDGSIDLQELQAKFEKTRVDYKQITDLNDELLRVDFENQEANKRNDTKRTNNPISVNAIKQQNELNERISKCKSEMKSIDVEFASKLNELRVKLDEKKLIEQQKVFNKFYESIKTDLLNFDQMKERLNNELNNSSFNNSANRKKRDQEDSSSSLLDNVLLDVTINSIKEGESDDEEEKIKKQRLDNDTPFGHSRSETRSNEFVSCNSDSENENDQKNRPLKTPLSGRASTFGESFHSVEDGDDDVIENENRESDESVIFKLKPQDDLNSKETSFQIANESSDILIDDDSGDNEVQQSDTTVTNTPRNVNESYHEFAEPKFFIPIGGQNVIKFTEAEYVRTDPDDKNVSDGEYEFAEAKYFISESDQPQTDSTDGEYECAEPKFFDPSSDNISIKVIDDADKSHDFDKIQKQQQYENELLLKKLRDEMKEVEDKKARHEEEEKIRIAQLEAQLEEKRKQIELEEMIRKQEQIDLMYKLEKEMEDKRSKHEAEEKIRKEKLEKELEAKRKEQEELESERRRKLDHEIELKRKKQEEEENQRLVTLELEMKKKREQQEAEEREKVKKLEEELELKRKKQDEENREKAQQIENQLKQKMLEQEKQLELQLIEHRKQQELDLM